MKFWIGYREMASGHVHARLYTMRASGVNTIGVFQMTDHEFVEFTRGCKTLGWDVNEGIDELDTKSVSA